MTIRPVVHYHSDCPFFAGSENMLANFFADSELRTEFDVSFSYRYSNAYADGLARRAVIDFPVFPIRFPEPAAALPVGTRAPRLVQRGARVISRQLATYPLLAAEVSAMRRILRRVKPDIVHVNNGGYPAALSARAAAIAAADCGSRATVMVVNNMAEPNRDIVRPARAAVDRVVARSVTRFVTGSEAARARLRDVLGLADEHVVALHNGIARRAQTEALEATLARLHADADSVHFAMVANFEPRKGHAILIEAVRIAISRPASPRFDVLIEGDGPLRHILEAAADCARLGTSCRFIGHEANVMNLMGAADVLVLPSVSHEDFPNVILEAMSLGKPVIASRIAGTPEQVVDGVTGLLVPPADPAALADAIVRLAGDASLRGRMGAAARERYCRMFTAERAVARYRDLYHSLLHRPTA